MFSLPNIHIVILTTPQCRSKKKKVYEKYPKENAIFSRGALTLFRMMGVKITLSNSFSPVLSTNVGINPQDFPTFDFNPFTTLV